MRETKAAIRFYYNIVMDFDTLAFLINGLLTSGIVKELGKSVAGNVTTYGLLKGGSALWQMYFGAKASASFGDFKNFQNQYAAIANYQDFEKKLAQACNKLAANLASTPPQEMSAPAPVVQLLGDTLFHKALAKWIASVTPRQREEAKARVIDELGSVLEEVTCSGQAADMLLEQLERKFGNDPVLREWKVPLQIDYMVSVIGEQEEGLRVMNATLRYLMYGEVSQEVVQPVMERYRCYLLRECRNIASPREMTLEDFYVELPLEVEERFVQSEGWGNMQEGAVKRTAAIGDLLRESNCIAVLGNSGTGKSTLLNWLAYVNLFQQGAFPDGLVLIRCRDLDQRMQEGSIEDILASHFGRLFPSKEAQMLALYFRDRLEQGKVLLLLDGLDELKNNRETRRKFFENAIELSRRCPHAKIVISSRQVAYEEICDCARPSLTSLVRKAKFQGLKLKDKKRLTEAWVKTAYARDSARKQKEYAQAIYQLLKDNREVDLMTETPLMFSSLLSIFQENGAVVPSSRAELYEAAVNRLLKHKVHPADARLNIKEILPFLEYLALEMVWKEAILLSEEDVRDILFEFPEKLKGVSPRKIRDFERVDIAQLLEDLSRHSGLLVMHGGEEHTWEFRHLAYQEYLAACAIIHGYCLKDSEALIISTLIQRHLIPTKKLENSSVWRESIQIAILLRKHPFNVENVVELFLEALKEQILPNHYSYYLTNCIFILTKLNEHTFSAAYDEIIKKYYEWYTSRELEKFSFSPSNPLKLMTKRKVFNIFCKAYFFRFELMKKNNCEIIKLFCDLFQDTQNKRFKKYNIHDVIIFMLIFKVIIWDDFKIDNLKPINGFDLDNSIFSSFVEIIGNYIEENHHIFFNFFNDSCIFSTWTRYYLKVLNEKSDKYEYRSIQSRICKEIEGLRHRSNGYYGYYAHEFTLHAFMLTSRLNENESNAFLTNPKANVGVLFKLLDAEDKSCEQVVEVIGELEDSSAIEPLTKLLYEGDESLCQATIGALVRLKASSILQEKAEQDDTLWGRIICAISLFFPGKLRNEYSFLVREFRPEEEWGEMEEEERERWRTVRERRLDMLKGMMHSEVWRNRAKAANVLDGILVGISPDIILKLSRINDPDLSGIDLISELKNFVNDIYQIGDFKL